MHVVCVAAKGTAEVALKIASLNAVSSRGDVGDLTIFGIQDEKGRGARVLFVNLARPLALYAEHRPG